MPTDPITSPFGPPVTMACVVDPVTTVVDEAVFEALGGSRRKWALVVVALAATAFGAMWISALVRPGLPATVADEAPST